MSQKHVLSSTFSSRHINMTLALVSSRARSVQIVFVMKFAFCKTYFPCLLWSLLVSPLATSGISWLYYSFLTSSRLLSWPSLALLASSAVLLASPGLSSSGLCWLVPARGAYLQFRWMMIHVRQAAACIA